MLDGAHRTYSEDPAGALAAAIRCHEQARSTGDTAMRSRALALQGAIDASELDMLANQADARLYAAKRAGRDRVVAA